MAYLAAGLFMLALFALRWLPAGHERLAFDEAHHAGWARRIVNGDPFMQTIAADKPPQLYYLVAAAFGLLGENEVAARLPNALAGALIVWPLWALARRLYPSQPAVAPLAVGLVALSPLMQVYAPTVFTDPLMGFWLVVCAGLVAARRWTLAGLAFGMAVCAKQQALFFLPFPVFLACAGYLATWHSGKRTGLRIGVGWLGRAAVGLALPVAAVVAFDKWRGQASSLAYGATLNGEKLALAHPGEWPGRLASWWNRTLQYFLVPNPFGLVLLAGLVLFAVWTAWKIRRMWLGRAFSRAGEAGGLVDAALVLACAIALGWHTVLTFPVWDRYLLPMVPFVALVAARMLLAVGKLLPLNRSSSFVPSTAAPAGRFRFPPVQTFGPALVVLILMVQPVAAASAYRLPLGGDYLAFGGQGPGQHGAYEGIQNVAGFFERISRPGPKVVVFHEEMDWHFSYYLFGLPLEIPSNRSRPLDPALVASTAARTESYVVLADWQQPSYERLKAGLEPYNLFLEEALQVYPVDSNRLSFVVYRVAPYYPASHNPRGIVRSTWLPARPG